MRVSHLTSEHSWSSKNWTRVPSRALRPLVGPCPSPSPSGPVAASLAAPGLFLSPTHTISSPRYNLLHTAQNRNLPECRTLTHSAFLPALRSEPPQTRYLTQVLHDGQWRWTVNIPLLSSSRPICESSPHVLIIFYCSLLCLWPGAVFPSKRVNSLRIMPV